MQFDLPLPSANSRLELAPESWLRVGTRQVPLRLVPNRRARRYVLRLTPDGAARVTIPRGGSAIEARRFAERNVPWLERQLGRQACRPTRPAMWGIGTAVLFRGESSRLEAVPGAAGRQVRLGTEVLRVRDSSGDLRPEVERYLWRLAARELTERTIELAGFHGIPIRRVSVRNQRSRWGSCSRKGTISLNWRLIQTPPWVRDYIVLHELAHVKEMNHSDRFWREVARLCPGFAEAERWLKRHAELLR